MYLKSESASIKWIYIPENAWQLMHSWLSKNNTHSYVTYLSKPGKYGIKIGVFQVALGVKNLSANAGDKIRCGFNPWVGKIPWRRKWQPTPVFLPGESHGQRSLTGYNPWGHKNWTQLKRPMTQTHMSHFLIKVQVVISSFNSYLCKLFVKRLNRSTGHKMVNGDDYFSWHARS